jgi:hypothetical protein
MLSRASSSSLGRQTRIVEAKITEMQENIEVIQKNRAIIHAENLELIASIQELLNTQYQLSLSEQVLKEKGTMIRGARKP